MNILEKFKTAIEKLETETGEQANCITLHPEHLKEIKETSRELLVMFYDYESKEEPRYELYIPGINPKHNPVKAFLARGDEKRNACLRQKHSIVGSYDYELDTYLGEEIVSVM